MSEDAFKNLLSRFRRSSPPEDKARFAESASLGEVDATSNPESLDGWAGNFGVNVDVLVSIDAGESFVQKVEAISAVENERGVVFGDVEEGNGDISFGASPARLVRQEQGVSPDRMALFQRVAQEARGEGAETTESFDMGYSVDIASVGLHSNGGLKAIDQGSENALLPDWARSAIQLGFLGESLFDVFQGIDALGLIDDVAYAKQVVSHWSVPAVYVEFSELASLSISARTDLPEGTRQGDRLGRDGYFFLKGDSRKTNALIVVDGSSLVAASAVKTICNSLDAAGKSFFVAVLSSHEYRWAVRRFVWPEIVVSGDAIYALSVSDASRAYAAPIGNGRRLILQESVYGTEAIVALGEEEVKSAAGSSTLFMNTSSDGVWVCDFGVGEERNGKTAPLSAFGLNDQVTIDRLMAEFSRPGAIVFVAGELAYQMTASLVAAAWHRGVPVVQEQGNSIDGVATVLVNPRAEVLRQFASPVIAVYPAKKASPESALMFIFGEDPEWARGRVVMGVSVVRVPGLCPVCALPVDADQAARELTEVVSDFRGARFETVRTRNVQDPCCGNGYAGEVWLSEVWDSRVFQKEIGATMLSDLVEKGLRNDQRISSKLLNAVQAGVVDYRVIGGGM
ncbi:hypothetical protein [Vogesella sp. XCS3]|uniref:hypothetical protein n=1 Tax=Vogesella sp. XCS3 TaxID=2877939 RepID=UPI001D0AA383|nr:hypothetical protein [Vogesella sp. XCS3]UDM18820.1 hypothetical protein LCH97_18275 [Vogesella sp. XCS3]